MMSVVPPSYCPPESINNIPSLLSSLKPGQKVIFEFIEESPGAYVVTHIYPAAGHNLGPLQEH